MQSQRTYYEVLGIPEHADAETIRTAFRSAAKRHHPDKSSQTESREFREVCEAYETLRDHHSRSAYDAQLAGTRGTRRPSYRSGAVRVNLRPGGGSRPNRVVREAYRSAGAAVAGNAAAAVFGAFSALHAGLEEMRAGWLETRLAFTDGLLGRDGSGIDYDLEVSRAEAERGLVFDIPVESASVRVQLPSGVRHGDIFEVQPHGTRVQQAGIRIRVVIV